MQGRKVWEVSTIADVGNKLEEFFYLIDVTNSVFDEVITKQPILMSYKIFLISLIYSASFFFHSSQDELAYWR